ncbi:MAG TPA: cyclic nucleotide-binding domain-containing protein [Clostridiaceae bacterium]|nr:cyclic nucleotide-binding domain-containing protein [Clostridiaceae bacterium]
MNEFYENLLSSNSLRSFFSLNEEREIPKELYLILDRIKTRHFTPGERIIREGDKADSLFIIENGQADVISESSGGVLIGQLNSGDFFGEVALLTGKTRTASIVAKTDMTVYEIFKDDLEQVTKSHPHIIGTLLQKLYDRLKVSYLSLEEKNEELKKMNKIRTELASLFTSIVLLITSYTFILGLLSTEAIVRHLPEQSSYFISRIIEVTTLALVVKIIRNSSLSWKDFGLTLSGAKKSIMESLVISLAIMGILALAKYALIVAYPDKIPDKRIIVWEYFDYTYVTYLVVAPLQEFITRGVVQSSLERLLVGRSKVVLSIIITSLLFGSLHVFASIYLALAAVVTGWLWGWMYYRHKNLIGISISHFLIGNFTGLLGLWVIF